MPEETAVAESVTSTEAPVALDPALLNKPIRLDEQQNTGDGDLMRTKLNLANQHAKQAKKEADDARQQLNQLREEMGQLKEAQQTAVRHSLEEQGQYKQLWEDLKKTNQQLQTEIVELKAQNESVTREREQDRLRAAALSQINQAGALNSQQMFVLLQTALRTDDEGNPAVLNGGVEQPLSDYLANLKQSAEWQHHFSASGARGMGTAPAASVAPGRDNPYRSGNLTEALKLEIENPELAKALKAEAQRG